MGVCLSSEEFCEKVQSYNIDRSITKDNKKKQREYKLLLLGCGESGKTTILKQMKMCFGESYTKEDLLFWKIPVYRNLIQSAQAIANALIYFGYQQNEKIPHETQVILNYKLQDTLDPIVVRAMLSLWESPVTQTLLAEKSSEFYLMDSAPYFFDEIERISQPDYVPICNDVLRARVKTTGIVEAKFRERKLTLRMFDVGGQRSERKKWIHCFEAVHSIIFCVSTSEYDQVLLEERQQNRLLESLTLFESIVNSRWFITTTIILFLNKMDIFKEKITRIPMEKYFPDYGGGADEQKAIKYILWRFNQTNRANLKIYPHKTTAIDTELFRNMMEVVIETIRQTNLRTVNML